MRRREYLQYAVGAAGAAGLSATALRTAARAPSSATGPGTQSFEPLGRVEVTNDGTGFQATEAVTTPDGAYAFVAKLDGFVVVDLADPADPRIVATREDVLADTADGPMRQIKDLKYNRDRVLLMTDTGQGFTGIALFDVSDRTDPRLAASHGTGYPIHNGDLHGDHAYLTTGSALDVVDVSTPEPSRVGTWSLADYDDAYLDAPQTLWNLHDLYVQDDRAYLAYWDGGTWILDVSDPTTPTHLGHAREYAPDDLASMSNSEVSEAFYEPPGNAHYVQPNDDGTVMAVGGESWDVEGEAVETDEPEEEDLGGPSGIKLYDVSDPAEPAKLATIDPPQPPEGETAARFGGYFTTSHNFDVVGDYLYSSWYRAGVKVHDISDPSEPEELGHWENGAETSFWTARSAVPGDFFVGTSHGNLPDEQFPGAFYTFPDPTDNGATVTPSGPDASPPSDSSTPTASATPTDSSTPTSTATSTPTDSPTTTDTTAPATGTETSSGGGAGFGVLAALGALGAGGWRLRGARDGDDAAND